MVIDELEVSKKIFEYKDKKIVSTIVTEFKEPEMKEVLTFASKYIIYKFKHNENECADANMVCDLLKRYSYFIVYCQIVDALPQKDKVLVFDKMLKNGCSIDGLQSFNIKDGVFGSLLALKRKRTSFDRLCNKIFEPELSELFNKNVEKLKNYVMVSNNINNKEKICKGISSLLNYSYDYFSSGVKLSYFEKANSKKTNIDQIVAECFADQTFKKFDFEIIDKTTFYKNIKRKTRGVEKYFALLINDIFEKGLQDDFSEYIIDLKGTYIHCMGESPKIRISLLKFIEGTLIDVDNIEPFQFFYKGQEFIFGKGNIVKVER